MQVATWRELESVSTDVAALAKKLEDNAAVLTKHNVVSVEALGNQAAFWKSRYEELLANRAPEVAEVLASKLAQDAEAFDRLAAERDAAEKRAKYADCYLSKAKKQYAELHAVNTRILIFAAKESKAFTIKASELDPEVAHLKRDLAALCKARAAEQAEHDVKCREAYDRQLELHAATTGVAVCASI